MPRFEALAQASRTSVNSSRREASIDAAFAQLGRAVENCDELLTGAEAKCRCGNYADAERRLAAAEKVADWLTASIARLHRRVTAASVVSSWR